MSRDTSRDESIKAMYQSGMTLQQIGDQHSLSRERIRQVLRKIGVSPESGGAAKRLSVKRDLARHAVELRLIQKHDVDTVTMQELRQMRVVHAWMQQRTNARRRGIGWHLTIGQFWKIWQDSGKWSNRGCGKGKYCLSRYGDLGDYRIGNVWVCEFAENCREASVRAVRGKGNVHCLYPGTKNPWVARYGKKFIGVFASRDEAVLAKERFMANNAEA